jgi:hypothetical protein
MTHKEMKIVADEYQARKEEAKREFDKMIREIVDKHSIDHTIICQEIVLKSRTEVIIRTSHHMVDTAYQIYGNIDANILYNSIDKFNKDYPEYIAGCVGNVVGVYEPLLTNIVIVYLRAKDGEEEE